MVWASVVGKWRMASSSSRLSRMSGANACAAAITRSDVMSLMDLFSWMACDARGHVWVHGVLDGSL
jgi:hypothetical protein